MSLEQASRIEGLRDDYVLPDMGNDTNPGAMIVKFDVRSIHRPFKSKMAGRQIHENEVWLHVIKDLGRSDYWLPVKDIIHFDEVTKKWEIDELVSEQESLIRQFPDAWNAFRRGSTHVEVGNDLDLLFPEDPAKCSMYKGCHIKTIEQLAVQNTTTLEMLPVGADKDVAKAKAWVKKVEEQAPRLEMLGKLEQKDQEIRALQNQITDLSDKLTQILQAQLAANAARPVEPPPVAKRGRPKKVTDESEESQANG